MIITPTASFTRPADTTAYGVGDLVANSTTAGSVTPLEFAVGGGGASRGIIRRVRITKSDNTATNASFNVHLFTASPTVTNGDNGALAVATAATYLGEVAVDMSSAGSPGTAYLFKGSAAQAIAFRMPNSGASLFGLVEALAAYTPASAEVFNVTLEIEGAL